MKDKIVVWGVGRLGEYLLTVQKNLFLKNYDILFVTDSNKNKWGHEFCGYTILPCDVLRHMPNIKVLIASDWYIKEIQLALINIGIKEENIIDIYCLEKKLVSDIKLRYKDANDPEIDTILCDYAKYGFNVLGSYYGKHSLHEVYRDKDNWPYIIFECKKMYYPKNYRFLKKSGKEYVKDILYEQGDKSPHQYIRNEHVISDSIKDGVLVDAGVCEGNFALRFVDIAKKVYLIESDSEWIEALKRTFAPYGDKVCICNMFLGRYNSASTIKLDSLVKEPINFLKMDIEGAEVDAILGGINALQKSNAECAICSYHNSGEAEYIEFLLEKLGYAAETSQGYMFFVYDPKMEYTMDFRKGIVYGTKKVVKNQKIL